MSQPTSQHRSQSVSQPVPQPTDSQIPDLTRFDAVLIDLDGTIYRENHRGAEILPGARELVDSLRHRGQPFACLTNSGLSPAQLQRRLAGMGMELETDQIWSCAAAAAEYVLARYGPLPRVYSLATDGFHELVDGQVAWTQDESESCDVVVVSGGVHPRHTPERLWCALQLLRRQPTALVGLCADRVFPSDRGLEFGSGAVTEMLAYASNIRPAYCGKPEAVFFQELCHRMNVKPSRCILLGDNLDSDIAGAKGVGMASALMLTGITDRGQLAKVPAEKRPDFVLDGLLELK